MIFEKSSSVTSKGSAFFSVCGIKYFLPGRTSRTELILAGIRFIESRILPSLSVKIILLCLPISSIMSFFSHMSPSSFLCSICIMRTRSRDGCVICVMRPLPMCLRSSIQNAGADAGLCLFLSLIYISGKDGFADITSLYVVPLFFTASISSSFSGCATFVIKPPASASVISFFIHETVIPSRAIPFS